MIVLHGTWKPSQTITDNGEFFLWGESSSPPIKQLGRPPKLSLTKARIHPFQADIEYLHKVITYFNPDDETAHFIGMETRHDNTVLLLPSFLRYPQASPDLIRDEDIENDEETVALFPWTVNGISIRPEDCVSLLTSLSGAWAGTDGATVGSDILFWSKVSKFVMELLSKQRFIPGKVVSEDNRNRTFARWQYILSEADDITRMSMLAHSMPPICMAVMGNRIPDSQEAFLSDFLNAAVDSCIKKWIPISEIRSKRKGLSNAWLRSLTTGEPIIAIDSGLDQLTKEITSWKAPVIEIEQSEFRTCFRLEPPCDDETGSDMWNLQYFLQASDDPSLLVPAQKVWTESDDTLEFLNRKFGNPQEKLLADLGKASKLYPPIEDSLHFARPETAQLTNQQAYTFLKEGVPLLTESGFSVLVPPWWDKGVTGSQLGLKLKLKSKREYEDGKGLFGFDSIIDYNWQLALGDEIISEEEFENLANLKEPLVRLRGKWVELKKEEIEAAIKFFKTQNSGEMKLSQALRLDATLEDPELPLPVNGFSASGWISELLGRLSGKIKISTLPQPDNFEGELRPYQITGFSWLAYLQNYGLGSCLADDMGLGKTIQMLALLLKNKEDGIDKPTLLICPTSVVGNWRKEAMRFAPSLRVLVHHGTNRRKNEEFITEVSHYDLVISTYALVHRDQDTFIQVEWNGAVLDEAQNIKNRLTKQSQAVRKLNADYRIAMTGTPVENRLSDLWSIMEFLNTGYLGSAEGFRRNFALPIERYNDKETGEQLKKLIQPFILRRLKTDPLVIKDLPEKIEIKEHCNLTKEQATLYEAIVKDMLRKIQESSDIERKGLVLLTLLRLKQACNHPALFLGDGSKLAGRSGKLNRITQMLEEVIAEGDAALIFTQYAEMGKMLKLHLQQVFGQEVPFLYGGVSQKLREKMIDHFSNKNGPAIFVLSLKAGGIGLNLTRASHVFHFDRWWNPAVENQATDRAFRIGQTKNVQVHKFICDGTLEERIDEIIKSKKALADNIIGTGEGWLTEMTTEQLKDIFVLRREAVVYE